MAEHTRLVELARDLSDRWTQKAQHREERLIARIAAMMEERHSDLDWEKMDSNELRGE